jgi:hypothetical protein
MEIRDRKLLEILKNDRTWLKYELHCNLLNISVYRLQPRLFMDSPPYLKKKPKGP